MFRSATLRLTLWYLALAMSISLIFSFALYNVTTHELSTGLRRETQRIYSQFPNFNRPAPLTDAEYDASTHNIWVRLVSFNVIVFLGSGLASYWLAKRTLQPIEEAHEQQKRFTSDVSHELRTPLTAIRMESEVALLDKKSTAAKLREILISNLEETAKLESLINNLLRLTKLEANEFQQDFKSVNLKAVVKQAVKQVNAIAGQRKIKISVATFNAHVDGDQESLIQLVVILLDNAIKYSPDNSKVTVSVTKKSNAVTLSVSDEGIGIDQQSLGKVFERFYRADTSRSKINTEGTGLGLSIAKSIADLHNSEISLSSELGKGTTVTIVLPKHQS